jgi:hypothetical protein
MSPSRFYGPGLTPLFKGFIDKQGIIRSILVTNINREPDMAACETRIRELNE